MSRTLKAIESETPVYREPACGARPFVWTVGDIEAVGEPGAPGCGLLQLETRFMSARDLPTEFFNHQLMACDASDPDAVADFARRWGLPYSPYRYSPFGYRAAGRGRARQELKRAFELTDALAADTDLPAISLAEARHAISCLQSVVAELRKAAAGEAHGDFTAVLNMASCNPMTAGTVEGSSFVVRRASQRGDHWARERLTSAICNQIIDTMADEAPWRLCACEGCGVVFKARADRSITRRNAKYCSITCQKRQEKRNQSASARNRKEPGTE